MARIAGDRGSVKVNGVLAMSQTEVSAEIGCRDAGKASTGRGNPSSIEPRRFDTVSGKSEYAARLVGILIPGNGFATGFASATSGAGAPVTKGYFRRVQFSLHPLKSWQV